MSAKCVRCNHTLKDDIHRCPSCGAWNWGTPHATAGDEAVALEDIQNADDKRIASELLDSNCGGGIVRTAVILLGGVPGAGKSTLLLQIAQNFCREGGCIYIASEEDLPAIKARAVRLGIKTERKLHFIPAMGGVADVGAILFNRKPHGIILDSLDGLVGHDHDAEIKTLEIIKKYAVLLEAPALVISQVNKDGDYSGLMAKQHAVDCLLTMTPDEDLVFDNGEPLRIVETLKNRHGRAYVKTFFEMTEKGLMVWTPPTEEQN